VIWALQIGSFIGFFAFFMAPFFFTGVGNASTFQMIPVIMREEIAPPVGARGRCHHRLRQRHRRRRSVAAWQARLKHALSVRCDGRFGLSLYWVGSPVCRDRQADPETALPLG